MSQTPKKKAVSKKRSDKYAEKVSLDMSFGDAIKKLADKANKAVAGSVIARKD